MQLAFDGHIICDSVVAPVQEYLPLQLILHSVFELILQFNLLPSHEPSPLQLIEQMVEFAVHDISL